MPRPPALTELEIEQVEYLFVRGVPVTAIAAELGRHANTISVYADPDARERYRARLFERCREERA